MGRGISFLFTLTAFHIKFLHTLVHVKMGDDGLISLLQIRDGIVIYVCFYKGATEKIIPIMGTYSDINDSIT